MQSIEVIVVLGNGNPVIYNSRASNAIKVFLEKIKTNENVFILPKFYENSWTLETFQVSLGIYNKNILTDETSKYYSHHPITHDTINEALGTRYVIEKSFNRMNVNLTVVTSKCHENRSRWIFETVFKDSFRVRIDFNSSSMTFNEIKLDRNNIEKNGLERISALILSEGGIYNYINNRNLAKVYTHFLFEKLNDFRYELKFNPPVSSVIRI
jgi:hypothetical protein